MDAAEEQVAGQPAKQGSYTVLSGQFNAAHTSKSNLEYILGMYCVGHKLYSLNILNTSMKTNSFSTLVSYTTSYQSSRSTSIKIIISLLTYGIHPQLIAICQDALPCSCRHERIVPDWHTEHHHQLDTRRRCRSHSSL